MAEVAKEYSKRAAGVCPGMPMPERRGAEPEDKKREGTHMLWLRLMPTPPAIPSGLWDRTWCNYHVCFGRHARFRQDADKSFEWFIGFVFATGNSKCHAKIYYNPLLEIVDAFARSRPKEYFLITPGSHVIDGRPWAYLNLIKRFYAEKYPVLEPKVLARDLLTLVRETFPDISSIKP